MPQRLADRRPRRRVPKPQRLVIRPRQDALAVRRIDRAHDRALMPQRLADRRPRRRVPKPQRLVLRPRQDALAVRRIERALDRAAVVQDRDRRMFGERKRKISDGVSQHRPFKDARAARPGRQAQARRRRAARPSRAAARDSAASACVSLLSAAAVCSSASAFCLFASAVWASAIAFCCWLRGLLVGEPRRSLLEPAKTATSSRRARPVALRRARATLLSRRPRRAASSSWRCFASSASFRCRS